MSATTTPIYLGLEINRRCNLSCPHCFTNSGPSEHTGPSEEAARSLITELAQAGIRRISFSGGEPLLREDLERLMAFGRTKGLEAYGLVTNGFLASTARVKALKTEGLKTVQVSLDGVDALDHGAVRRCKPKDFYQALRAIRLFREVGLEVAVACLLSPKNLQKAPEMVLLCEALEVKQLRYCTFIPTGRGRRKAIQRKYMLTLPDLKRFFEFAQGVNSRAAIPVQILVDHGVGPWIMQPAMKCQAGRELAYITAEGDLYPCPGLVHPPFLVGNVFEEPVAGLLASSAMRKTHHQSRKELEGPCGNCPSKDCGGGCRGAAYAASGRPNGPVLYCALASDQGKTRG